MGAKNWMLAYVEGDAAKVLRSEPELDREKATALAKELFPTEDLQEIESGDLFFTCPPEDELCVGTFLGLSIVAAAEFGIDYPSKLQPSFINASKKTKIILHAMHSGVDWFAFAVWENGKLRRALSLSPDSGILEDIGSRFGFEEPYWSGRHPVGPDYPLPFHPLEMAEAALLELFGYQLEGISTSIDPERINLLRFKRKTRR